MALSAPSTSRESYIAVLLVPRSYLERSIAVSAIFLKGYRESAEVQATSQVMTTSYLG